MTLPKQPGTRSHSSTTVPLCGCTTSWRIASGSTMRLVRRRRPETQDDDPERIAIREALAFGKALYDRRVAVGLSVADLACAEMTADEIECIEEGGTEPTVALLRRLAAALDADVRLTAGHDLGSVWFETHAA